MTCSRDPSIVPLIHSPGQFRPAHEYNENQGSVLQLPLRTLLGSKRISKHGSQKDVTNNQSKFEGPDDMESALYKVMWMETNICINFDSMKTDDPFLGASVSHAVLVSGISGREKTW